MGQQIAVYAIVAFAVVYVGWKLLPVALTRRLAAALLAGARVTGMSSEHLTRWERRVTAKACGACDACDGCASAASTKVEGKSVVRFERM